MAHESPQKVSQQFIWWLSEHPWRSFCKKDEDLINRLHVKRKPNDTEISNGKDFMLQSPNWQLPQSEWLTNLSRSISAVYLMVVRASSASFSPEHCPNARENSLAYHIAGISVPPCAWVCLLVFISIWIEILQLWWYTCIYLQYVGLDMKHADLMPSKRCGDSNFLKKKSSFCPCLFTLTWKRQVQPSKCQGFLAPKNVSSFIVQFRSNSPKSNIKKMTQNFWNCKKKLLMHVLSPCCNHGNLLFTVVECSTLQSPKSLRLAAKALGSELEWCQFLC